MRGLRFVILTSLICLAATEGNFVAAAAGNHYIAANGSDSNSGTAKTSPWLHAPGMPNCSATCAGYSPAAGDQFIFRGGDTWHFGDGSSATSAGGSWVWKWNGSSGNPIYLGVDQTWSSGTSWVRPIISGDNALSGGFVGSCAHDESGLTTGLVYLNAVSYVTFDNFEISGVCWAARLGGGNGMIYMPSTAHMIISNDYCHGWTTTTASYDNFPCIQGDGSPSDQNQFAFDIFDGSDSSHAPAGSAACQYVSGVPCQSGQGIQNAAYDVHDCIFRYLSNFMVTGNTHTVHDNLFEYLYYTYASGDQQHPNVLNNIVQGAGANVYFYNNIMRHTYVTENVYLAVAASVFVFNNVFYDNMNSQFGVVPNGCFRFNASNNANATQAAYIYNNTDDSSCQFIFDVQNSPLQPWNGTAHFENNHFIGFSGTLSSVYLCKTSGTCQISDGGNEVFQTLSAANAQGYTQGNNYAPTAGSNATVGAGANATTSCSTFSVDLALCSGTSDGTSEQNGSGGKTGMAPAIAVVARPSSGSWDAGAYYFGSAGVGAGKPNPPTALSAVVQ